MNNRWVIGSFVATLGMLVGLARADIGVVESTGALLVNGGSTTYLSTTGALENPRWAGYDLGVFDVSAGDTLTLTNFYFENYAYNGGSIPPGGVTNDNWLDNSSIATFTLLRDGNQIYQAAMRQAAVNGNNRNWDLAASGTSVNVLAGLSPGSYNIAWTIDWNYNQWIGSVITGTSQSSSTGAATFSVVPEPSAVALTVVGVAGLAGGLWRRRSRRAA